MIQISNKTKGYICAAVAACTYGINPLLTLPLYARGMNADSVLFFRYGLCRPDALGPDAGDAQASTIAPPTDSDDDSGGNTDGVVIAAAIRGLQLYGCGDSLPSLLFVYPVMVAIINTIFYRERLSAVTISAIAMATAGIMLPYEGDGTATLNITGTALVLLAALSYSIYMVAVNRTSLCKVESMALTFYSVRDRHSGIHCRYGMERIHSSDRCAGLDMCAVAGTVPHHNIACYNGNRHPQYRLDSDSYTWRTRAL